MLGFGRDPPGIWSEDFSGCRFLFVDRVRVLHESYGHFFLFEIPTAEKRLPPVLGTFIAGFVR